MKSGKSIWAMFHGGILLLSCLLNGQLFAAEAAAASAEVVIVRQRGFAKNIWPSLELRLQQELILANLTTRAIHAPAEKDVFPQGTDDIHSQLARAQQRTLSVGAVIVYVADDGSVWLHTLFRNPTTFTSDYHRHSLGCTPDDGNVEIAAIKAKEAVLATLYQLSPGNNIIDSPPLSAETPKNSDTKTAQSTEQRRPVTYQAAVERLRIAGILGIALIPGGLSPLGITGPDIQMGLSHRFALSVQGWISVLANDVRTDDASASVRLMAARIGASWRLIQRQSATFRAGIRLGAAYLQSIGKSEMIPVKKVAATLFYGGVFGEFSFVLNRHLQIPLSLGIGGLPPGVKIQFAGKPEATIDILILEATTGVAVTF